MYDKDIVIGGEISLSMNLDGNSSLSIPEDGIEGTVIAYEPHSYEEYTGSYELIPSDAEQELSTAEKVLLEDIIIHPIPANYGRLEWDGSVLTVY